jgi:hypothetical protein
VDEARHDTDLALALWSLLVLFVLGWGVVAGVQER